MMEENTITVPEYQEQYLRALGQELERYISGKYTVYEMLLMMMLGVSSGNMATQEWVWINTVLQDYKARVGAVLAATTLEEVSAVNLSFTSNDATFNGRRIMNIL